MYKPNPFRLSTLHQWIDETLEYYKDDIDISIKKVMKYIHKTHPGVLFSPHWFTVQYKKYMDTKTDQYIRIV